MGWVELVLSFPLGDQNLEFKAVFKLGVCVSGKRRLAPQKKRKSLFWLPLRE